MNTLRIDILNPKANGLLRKLVELDLIAIQDTSHNDLKKRVKRKEPDSSLAMSEELQKIYKTIDAGADISSFGDIKEWQRITRADRNVNFKGK
jgi:hypothetical protein